MHKIRPTHLATTLLSLIILIAHTSAMRAQGTAFTYQGSMSDNGSPASGIYDLRFALYTVETNGAAIDVVTNAATTIADGLFTVTLDFGGGVFDGGDRWLEIGVVTNGGGGFSTLSPRQPITATPYAVRALNLSSNALASYDGAVSFTNPSNTFAGDGSALSNINVSTVDGLSASNIWQLGGNADTTPGVNFLGTTDNQALELRVNNQRALRLEPNGAGLAPNFIGGIFGNNVASGTEGATIGGGGSATFPNLIFTNTDHSTIGGGVGNIIASGAAYATVAGGSGNVVGLDATYGSIGGGLLNNVRSSYGAIGGGYSLNIQTNSPYGALGGGQGNVIQANSTHSTISGGWQNTINVDADYSTVSGGRNNSVAGDRAAVGGGYDNNAQGSDSAIGGGQGNTTSSSWTTVGGGQANLADGVHSMVGGGRGNQAMGTYSTVAGGNGNTAEGYRATIGGGDNNAATVSGAAVGGGLNNEASGFYTAVAGGEGNTASQSHGAVAGGQRNSATGNYAAVLGGQDNTAVGGHSKVGGGELNLALGTRSTVSGGQTNRAAGDSSTIGGGYGNQALETSSTVGGGSLNTAFAPFSTVGGGIRNLAEHFYSTVSGGQSNSATGGWATIVGGLQNTASGVASTAAGYRCEAHGDYSFAAGELARVFHDNTFVWGNMASATNDQFVVYAPNGIALGGNDTSFGIVQVQQPSDDINHGLAVANVGQARTLRLWVDDKDYSHIDSGPTGGASLVINEGGGNVGIGASVPQHALDVVGNIVATGTITSSSDRNVKENFRAVDPQEVLEQVAAMPIQRWNYIGEDTPHLGPVAQDFYEAFSVGMDDKHISMVDADGVALAAIQGLNEKVERGTRSAELRLEQLQTENAELKQSVSELKQLVEVMNQQLNGGAK